jgi:hypothetical protein
MEHDSAEAGTYGPLDILWRIIDEKAFISFQ